MPSLTALYIGRFQPLHLGHVSVIQHIDNEPDVSQIVIGIGSSQYENTAENPFTYDLRKEMIEKSIVTKKPCSIVAVPDIHNLPKWPKHVLSIVGDIDVLYTGNDIVADAFLSTLEVREVQYIQNISASDIRKRADAKNSSWEKMVPQPVIAYMKAYYG